MEKLRITGRTLLRRAETIVKTDMAYLIKGGFWLVISQIIAIAAGFGLSIAMANLISPEVFGHYKFILSISGILGAFTLSGMGPAITRSVSRGFDGTLRAGAKVYLKWSMVVSIASAAVAAYYFYMGNMTMATAALFIGLFIPLLYSASQYSAFVSGKKDFRAQAIYNTFRNAVPAGVLVLTVLVTQNPVLIVLAYFVSNTLVTWLCYVSVVRRYKPGNEVDFESIAYAKHLSFMNIITNAADYVDKILVFHFLGAAQLAVYSFATAPVTQLKTPEKLVSELALPKFSESDLGELKRTLPRKIYLMMALMLGIVAAYILAAPYIYEFFFPQYLDAVAYSQVFALTLVFIPSVYSQALTAHMKTRELYTTRVILPILKIILFLIFIPLYGIWGVIGSLVITQAMRFGLVSYLFYKSA